MVGSTTRGPRRERGVHARAVAVCCALIAGGGWVDPASAQQSASPGPLDSLLEGMQLKGRAAPASGFVRDSRPPTAPDYIPVGRAHPSRPTKVMTPAEVAAAEADLDAARERQQRGAGHKPAVVPLKPPKGPATAKSTPR